MIILTIFFLILSISLNIRRDITISYTRIGTLMQIYCIYISYNNLYISYLYEGVGLFGGLFNISSISIIFHLLIFLLSLIIINLTSFYSIKYKWNILISNVKYILLKERKKIKSVKYTLYKLFSHVPGLPDISRRYLVKSWPFFLWMALVIISFFLVGLCLIDTCLFNTEFFRNILTFRLTSFYSLKSKFNILISNVKFIFLLDRQNIKRVKHTLHQIFLGVPGIPEKCNWRKYLIRGGLIFFYMALGILSFVWVGLGYLDMWLFNPVFFRNILTMCLTSFYSLKSKFNILTSKVKSILAVRQIITFVKCTLNKLLLNVTGITKICWGYLLKGLQIFFLIVLLGLGFIFWFKPVLFKYLFLLLIQLLYLIWFEIPANLILCSSESWSGFCWGNGGPSPEDNNSQILGSNFDCGDEKYEKWYPGLAESKHYSNIVNNQIKHLKDDTYKWYKIFYADWYLSVHGAPPRDGEAPLMLGGSLSNWNEVHGYWKESCDLHAEGLKLVKKLTTRLARTINQMKTLVIELDKGSDLKYIGPTEHRHSIVQCNSFKQYWTIPEDSSKIEQTKLLSLNFHFTRLHWQAGELCQTIDRIKNYENEVGIVFTDSRADWFLRRQDNIERICMYGTPAEIEEFSIISSRDTSGFKLIPIDLSN